MSSKLYTTSPPVIDPRSIKEHLRINYGIEGKLTFFPDYLAHYTDEVKNDLRITVAFDMITEQAWKEDIKEDMKSHWEPLHK